MDRNSSADSSACDRADGLLDVLTARRKVLEQAGLLPSEVVGALGAVGRVTAEPIYSPEDVPALARSKMDGFALRSEDIQLGRRQLEVLERIGAGTLAGRSVEPGTAIQIMTGAVIPAGADAVVAREEARHDVAAGRVEILRDSVRPGLNVIPAGDSLRRGDLVIPAGQALSAAHVGVLAEIGRTTICVSQQPRVAILATGDELVAADTTPAPGQIRNSNSPLLAALVREHRCEPVDLGMAADRREVLEEKIRLGLAHDVLLISGGVSAGDFDLVPGVLERLGVRRVFHGLRLKPGKPLWFGVRDRGGLDQIDLPGVLVFGLPGNPVSGLVCFHLLVAAALARLAGHQVPETAEVETGRLATPFSQRSNRPTYWPARTRRNDQQIDVEPLAWRGSHDLRPLMEANGLAIFPSGKYDWPAGQIVEYLPL